jgi:hypothetical protein
MRPMQATNTAITMICRYQALGTLLMLPLPLKILALDKFEPMRSAGRKIEKKSSLVNSEEESPFQQAISHILSCRDPLIIFKF